MSEKKVFISSNHTPSYFVYPPVGGYFDFCIQICHYNGGLSYKRTKSASGLRLPHPLSPEGSPADFARRRWSPLGDSFLGEALSEVFSSLVRAMEIHLARFSRA